MELQEIDSGKNLRERFVPAFRRKGRYWSTLCGRIFSMGSSIGLRFEALGVRKYYFRNGGYVCAEFCPLRVSTNFYFSNFMTFYNFYRLFILKSEVLASTEGRQIRVRVNFLDVLGSFDVLMTEENISGFILYIYDQNFVNSSPLKL